MGSDSGAGDVRGKEEEEEEEKEEEERVRCVAAAVQMSMSASREENVDKAEAMVREAVAQGANLVLLPELFEGEYFCKEQRVEELGRAEPVDGGQHATIERFRALAAELSVVLPLSVYEQANQALFNTVVVVDADGSVLGKYRKSHIPDGPGYSEKFYFSPGDTGFGVWQSTLGFRCGVAICWDQWFIEAARCMALLGADVLLYPTAIGSEPPDPKYDSQPHWQLTMQGHAAANAIPVVAANRHGSETQGKTEITFYGSTFVADVEGAKIREAPRTGDTVLVAEVDVLRNRERRKVWGILHEARRPDLYEALLTLDGSTGNTISSEAPLASTSSTSASAPAAPAAAALTPRADESAPLCVAAVQMSNRGSVEANMATAERYVREAASQGANLVVLPELFETDYFPKVEDSSVRDMRAQPVEGHPAVEFFQPIAAELGTVLILNVYEREDIQASGTAEGDQGHSASTARRFNSAVVLDADGVVLGVYRKAHIPNGVGCREQYYFSPGDTGFRVWQTKVGAVGVGICKDQWLPEVSRSMALRGADVLVFPTSAGREPPHMHDYSAHWQRVIQGQSAANLMPICIANRVGREALEGVQVDYFGSSFITNCTGAIVAQAGRKDSGVVLATVDRRANRLTRHNWGIFRDRRPELYGMLVDPVDAATATTTTAAAGST